MGRKALLFMNPKARQRAELPRVMQVIQAAGLELIEMSANAPDGIAQAIRTQKLGAEAVIIAGGDGTCNAAADALVETQLSLGILPFGTANDLARTLGINNVQDAAAAIARGQTRRIDLGWVNGKHYFNVASLGLSVRITRELGREAKSRWGVLAYLITTLRMMATVRPFTVEIRSGERHWKVKTMQIAVGNGRYYGGGMVIHEDAQIDDGLLHLYSLEVRKWWQLLGLAPALRKGQLFGEEHARTLIGREFSVEPLRRSRAINTDGEITVRTPAQIRVVPKCLSVFSGEPPKPAHES